MGGEHLSQAEVASLTGNLTPPAGQAEGLRRAGAARANTAAPLDFHYAERIGPAALRALESMHQDAARDFAAALSVLVRTTVKLQITGVRQTTCAEMVRSMEKLTCLSLIKANALPGTLALDVSPTIMFAVIDRLLGGSHDAAPPPERPLTAIEKRLATRVTSLWLEAAARAWQHVAPLVFELLRVETSPQVAAVTTPSELVVVVHGELTVADATGPVRFCFPSKSLEAVRDRLLGVSPTSASATPGPAAAYVAGTLELVAELASVRLPAREVAGLRVGDIITTDTSAQAPLSVTIGGTPCFLARPGAFKGRRAVALVERVEPAEKSAG